MKHGAASGESMARRRKHRCDLLSLPWNLRKCGMLCASFANHAASFHCHFCEQQVGIKNTQQSTKQTVNKMVHIVTVAVEAEAALRQIVEVVDLVDESDSNNDDADTDLMESTTGGFSYLETDATDVTFKVARRVEEFTSKFPEGTMMSLPSTERLIMQVSSAVVIYVITVIDYVFDLKSIALIPSVC